MRQSDSFTAAASDSLTSEFEAVVEKLLLFGSSNKSASSWDEDGVNKMQI